MIAELKQLGFKREYGEDKTTYCYNLHIKSMYFNQPVISVTRGETYVYVLEDEFLEQQNPALIYFGSYDIQVIKHFIKILK